MSKQTAYKPARGFSGLKENWGKDLTSGLLVFMLALPLSLGIAKASGFPPAMGVLTAIVGGMVATFFNVGELTIKGPAAGLITVCAGAVTDFGGGDAGWHAACGVIVVMAVLQVVFGLLKFGSLSDFFPHSAVHGMLAAIGIIIIAKQIPVLLGVEPSLYKGEGPIELLLDIPRFVANEHLHIAIVGLVGLATLFILPQIKLDFMKKVPGPLVVLLITVPLSLYWHFKETEQSYSLVTIGDFWGSVNFNADFSQIGTGMFWKYVVMFLFVSSLESLLTVKAVDNLDPFKRTSNYNGDLKGQGAANLLAGLLGGLPMISEVVRSSANVTYGARTKWSNFFHGLFLLVAMLLLIPFIEMIPNAALAAMLIFAGYRLAAPKEFVHTYHIGKEQLAIFLTTIVVTLAEDLLLGVAAGILVKFIFHLYNGAPLQTLFKAKYTITDKGDETVVTMGGSAVFSNLIGYKKMLTSLPKGKKVSLDLTATLLIDHSFMAFVNHFMKEYNGQGGDMQLVGLEKHRPLSDHPLATRKLKTRSNKGRSLKSVLA